ncbi:HIT family protein [Candidatus Berkelbacteria bacterium]|nr:HIT family protein [Candidatus Berkelbacteria bacterium]
MIDSQCIFCQIAAKSRSAYTVWEDRRHLAFLTPFPNTEGVTVVISKDHQSSDIFDVSPSVRAGIVTAATTVSELLKRAFPDVGRIGLVFEGFGVNHLHAKLFPMHGTNMKEWQPIRSKKIDRRYFDRYPGYLMTNDYSGISEQQLTQTQVTIRAQQKE